MESRTLKYMDTGNNEQTNTRSSRNSRLYREVYGKYGDLDNLPLQDNIDEIDMTRLKEIMASDNEKNITRESKKIDNNIKKQDDQKVYDINKLLEKAKYENSKLKEPIKNTTQTNREILETLESRELSLEEIKKACQKNDQDEKDNNKEELSMTRELKYHTKQISIDPLIEQVMPDNDLSLDILEDLKPTENTVVTEPITEEKIKKVEENFHSSDTSDIDIIKNVNSTKVESKKTSNIDNDFYTSSYKFSKKDFNYDEDEDFSDEEKTHNALKIILLIIAIIAFILLIYYFITHYGIGA